MAKTIHSPSAFSSSLTEQIPFSDADRYALVVLATHDAVWILDIATRRIEWNDNFHRLFGYPPGESIAALEFWEARLHPEDLPRVRESFEAAINGKHDQWQEEYRFQRADGSYACILDRGFLVRDSNRRPIRMVGAMQDITDRKLAEEQLKEKERRFRALVENSASVTALFDPNGKVTYISPARRRILGMSASEALGRHLHEFIHPDDRERIEEAFTRSLRHPRKIVPIEVRAIHQDGSVCWLEGIFNNLLEDPAVKAIVCNYRDITLRKESEEDRTRLARIIECTSDLVGIANADLKLFYLNKAFRNLLHIRVTENICDLSIPQLFPPEARERTLKQAIQIASDQGIWSGETVLLTRKGDEVPVSQVILAHKSDSGEIVHFSTIIRDITDRKRAEDAVRRSNEELERRVKERTAQLEAANHELESFSYTVSHDLRAPVRAIQGMSEALLEDCGSSLRDECREYLDRLSNAAVKMERLINDLLELAHVNRARMNLESLNLSDLVKLIAREPNAASPRLFHIDPTPPAMADRRLMTIALENLVGNAWKFTSKTRNAVIHFGSFTQRDETVYFLRDNGAGFDMSMASRLFAPFERLHTNKEFEGTGVGLATVQRIINRHHGRIWAEGKPGEGATFYLTLPAPPASPTQSGEPGQQPPRP